MNYHQAPREQPCTPQVAAQQGRHRVSRGVACQEEEEQYYEPQEHANYPVRTQKHPGSTPPPPAYYQAASQYPQYGQHPQGALYSQLDSYSQHSPYSQHNPYSQPSCIPPPSPCQPHGYPHVSALYAREDVSPYQVHPHPQHNPYLHTPAPEHYHYEEQDYSLSRVAPQPTHAQPRAETPLYGQPPARGNPYAHFEEPCSKEGSFENEYEDSFRGQLSNSRGPVGRGREAYMTGHMAERGVTAQMGQVGQVGTKESFVLREHNREYNKDPGSHNRAKFDRRSTEISELSDSSIVKIKEEIAKSRELIMELQRHDSSQPR